ncbi:MAG: lytic transglycosylase domain-containing protein [Betaproteobacteria bacterium]|nr:lytic transglycosylase domain-containing protein [Betaproteobacteria bacterium]
MWCSARRRAAVMLAFGGLLVSSSAHAGNQIYEPMAASVQSQLQGAVADQAHPRLVFDSEEQADHWMTEMSKRLRRHLPDEHYRREFLTSVQYEAKRAGLDPQLVLGIIDIESKFRKYAVSSAGARGYMQVMPFWRKVIGSPDHNLFHMRTNLRYGCLILRHYMDIERGNLVRALGRYNGSLGRMEYPNLVMAAWKRWAYSYKPKQVSNQPPPLNYRGASE